MLQSVFHNILRGTLTELVNILNVHLQYVPSDEVIFSADLTTVLEEPRPYSPKVIPQGMFVALGVWYSAFYQ